MNAPARSPGTPKTDAPVTIVTQTRVHPEAFERFGLWQDAMEALLRQQPGFLEHKVLMPSPPEQVDWVILQRFATTADAVAWMNSPQRLARLDEAAPFLVGIDDVHLVRDVQGGFAAPVSAVIATRIKPGMEAAYRKWERRIAQAQTKAPGFQGYRFEPPIAGVQKEFLAIMRFDTEANLNLWLASPARARLLVEAEPLTDGFHARVVRSGFEQWFPTGSAEARPAAWKQNMLVLLMLYPVVFLFGLLVQAPLLMGRFGMPFPIALFVGNVASVILLNFLVPWVSARFAFWLAPAGRRIELGGTALIVALYVLMIIVFYTVASRS
jgi:hypothetical protein